MAYEDRLNGSITVEQYNEIATKKEKRIKELEEALKHLEEQDNDVSVDASYLLELAQRLPELFENSRSGIRNEILQLIFSNLKIEQKKHQFTLLEPFNSLYQRANKRKWLRQMETLRTSSIPYDEVKFENVKVLIDNYSTSPILTQMIEDNR